MSIHWVYLGGISFFAILAFILIHRHLSGDDIEFDLKFFKISMKPNEKIRALGENLKNLNEEYNTVSRDSKHKSNVMHYVNEINRHAMKMVETAEDERITSVDYEHNYGIALRFSLHLIKEAVHTGKPGRSRISILVPDAEMGNLKILEGDGYSPEGIREFKLSIPSSFAGQAFTLKKLQYSNDSRIWTSHFEHVPSQKQYLSLVCVPLVLFDAPLGILNIDCTEQDAFSPDELDYLQFFSNQLSLLMGFYEMGRTFLIARENSKETAVGGETIEETHKIEDGARP